MSKLYSCFLAICYESTVRSYVFGFRVGGEVSSLAWDRKGCHLAITFKNSDIIAVFMTSLAQKITVSPW